MDGGGGWCLSALEKTNERNLRGINYEREDMCLLLPPFAEFVLASYNSNGCVVKKLPPKVESTRPFCDQIHHISKEFKTALYCSSGPDIYLPYANLAYLYIRSI